MVLQLTRKRSDCPELSTRRRDGSELTTKNGDDSAVEHMEHGEEMVLN